MCKYVHVSGNTRYSKLKNQHFEVNKILVIILQSPRASIRQKTDEGKCLHGESLTLLAALRTIFLPTDLPSPSLIYSLFLVLLHLFLLCFLDIPGMPALFLKGNRGVANWGWKVWQGMGGQKEGETDVGMHCLREE